LTKTSTVVLNEKLKQNLWRVAIEQHISLSQLLNIAGQKYVEEYDTVRGGKK
jgi:hypothetical protein